MSRCKQSFAWPPFRSSFTSVRSSPSCIEKLASSDELVGSARCADHDGVRG